MPLVLCTGKSVPCGLHHSQKSLYLSLQGGLECLLSKKKKPEKETQKHTNTQTPQPLPVTSCSKLKFFLPECPEQLGSGSCLQPLALEEQPVQIPEEFLVQTSPPAAAPAPGAAPGAAPAQAGESLCVSSLDGA